MCVCIHSSPEMIYRSIDETVIRIMNQKNRKPEGNKECV